MDILPESAEECRTDGACCGKIYTKRKKWRNIRGLIMEHRKPDRRVIKTKRAIYMAFAGLLSEREINDITVRDIADRADINRKTFYNYYSGVHAVLDEIENEVVGTLENALRGTDFREAMSHPQPVFEKLTAIISTDLDFYGHLLSMQTNVSLISKTVKLLKQKTREAMLLQLPAIEDEIDILLDYTFSGMLTVYQQWFNSDRKKSIDEISEILGELCVNGLNGILAISADQEEDHRKTAGNNG